MVDPKQMFRNDGSYDFKKREDWDYKHGYNFMSGWLGTEEAKKELQRKKKLGTTDMPAPPIPTDAALVDTIEKTATYIHKSKDPPIFERLIQERNKGKEGWDFLYSGSGESYDYYLFVRHCLEREVNARPLAEQARKVNEDRARKQINAKSNAFAMPATAEPAAAPRAAVFKVGELMEVLGVKSKPDYNGKIVRVVKFHPAQDRYEVKFDGGRYDGVSVVLREENLMYSAISAQEARDANVQVEGEIPNGTRLEIRGLKSEAALWMNGQKGVLICWDKEAERYEVRLDLNNTIKKVKAINVKAELPAGWEEHWDDHLSRHYYLHVKTQKVTWKHPVVNNQRGKMGHVRENSAVEFEEVEIDKDRTHYEVDDEEEGEGQFNLQELVKKVEEQELRKEEAEDKGEDAEDSDDGMHRVSRKKRKKTKKVEVKDIKAKMVKLGDETMVRRITMKKDYMLLPGNFIAVKEMDPYLVKLQAAVDAGAEPEDDLLRAVFEVTIGGLEKAAELTTELTNSKLTVIEMDRVADRLATLTTPAQLLTDAQWVNGLLKTM